MHFNRHTKKTISEKLLMAIIQISRLDEEEEVLGFVLGFLMLLGWGLMVTGGMIYTFGFISSTPDGTKKRGKFMFWGGYSIWVTTVTIAAILLIISGNFIIQI